MNELQKEETVCINETKRKLNKKKLLVSVVAVFLSVLLVIGGINVVAFTKKPFVKLAMAFAKTYSADSFSLKGEFEMSDISLDLAITKYDLNFSTKFQSVYNNQKGENASVVVNEKNTTLKYSAEGYSASWKNGSNGKISKDDWTYIHPTKWDNFCDISSALIFKDFDFVADRLNNTLKKEVFSSEGLDECINNQMPQLLDQDKIQKHLKLKEISKDGNTVIQAEIQLIPFLEELCKLLAESESAFVKKEDFEKCKKLLENGIKLLKLIDSSCKLKADFTINHEGYLTNINAVVDYKFKEKEESISLKMEYGDFDCAEIPKELETKFRELREKLGEEEYAYWDESGFYTSEAVSKS